MFVNKKKYQEENIDKIKRWSNQIDNYNFDKNICNMKSNQNYNSNFSDINIVNKFM